MQTLRSRADVSNKSADASDAIKNAAKESRLCRVLAEDATRDATTDAAVGGVRVLVDAVAVAY